MAMRTERLLIRKFSPDDWRGLYAYLSQEAVVKYEPYEVYTPEACVHEAEARSLDKRFWAVCLLGSGKLIGNIFLAKKDYGAWELGYVFNADYQGMGYATEAARALVGYAFVFCRARRVTAMCNPENRPSWKLLERLGMRREGHLRRNIYFKTDETGAPIWQDTYEYGILAEEWPAVRLGFRLE
jgi:RimJ/RimL family protein N-acetyltransferase